MGRLPCRRVGVGRRAQRRRLRGGRCRRRRARPVRPHGPERARGAVRCGHRRPLPARANPGRRPSRAGPGMPGGRSRTRSRRRHRRRLHPRRARCRAARRTPAEPPGADAAARANPAGARRLERRRAHVRVGCRAARARDRRAPARGLRPRGGLRRLRGHLVPVVRRHRRRPAGDGGGRLRRSGSACSTSFEKEPGRSPAIDPFASSSACSDRRRSFAVRSTCCSWWWPSTSSTWASRASASSPPRSASEGSSVHRGCLARRPRPARAAVPALTRRMGIAARLARRLAREWVAVLCLALVGPREQPSRRRGVHEHAGERIDERVIGRIFGLFELVVIATVGTGSLARAGRDRAARRHGVR